jgi:hypothetical protein
MISWNLGDKCIPNERPPNESGAFVLMGQEKKSIPVICRNIC